MSFTHTLGRLLGFENVTSIDEITPTFGAPWANSQPFFVFLGCVALAALSFWFYAKYQSQKEKQSPTRTGRCQGLCSCVCYGSFWPTPD